MGSRARMTARASYHDHQHQLPGHPGATPRTSPPASHHRHHTNDKS